MADPKRDPNDKAIPGDNRVNPYSNPDGNQGQPGTNGDKMPSERGTNERADETHKDTAKR